MPLIDYVYQNLKKLGSYYITHNYYDIYDDENLPEPIEEISIGTIKFPGCFEKYGDLDVKIYPTKDEKPLLFIFDNNFEQVIEISIYLDCNKYYKIYAYDMLKYEQLKALNQWLSDKYDNDRSRWEFIKDEWNRIKSDLKLEDQMITISSQPNYINLSPESAEYLNVHPRASYFPTHGLKMPKVTHEILETGKFYNHALDPNFVPAEGVPDNIILPGIGLCATATYPSMDIEPIMYIFTTDYRFICIIRLYENKYAFNSPNHFTDEQVKVFNEWFTEKRWKWVLWSWESDNQFTNIFTKEKPDYSSIEIPSAYSVEDSEKFEYKCEFDSMWFYISHYHYEMELIEKRIEKRKNRRKHKKRKYKKK